MGRERQAFRKPGAGRLRLGRECVVSCSDLMFAIVPGLSRIASSKRRPAREDFPRWRSRRVESQRRRISLMWVSFLIVRLVRHSFKATAEADLSCHSLGDGGEAIPTFKFHWHHACYGLACRVQFSPLMMANVSLSFDNSSSLNCVTAPSSLLLKASTGCSFASNNIIVSKQPLRSSSPSSITILP